MHKVEDAVKFLKSTYGNLETSANSWNLNPVEVHETLANTPTGTAEHYVLTLLAKVNPLPFDISSKGDESLIQVKSKKKPKIVDVDLSLRDKQVDEAFSQVEITD